MLLSTVPTDAPAAVQHGKGRGRWRRQNPKMRYRLVYACTVAWNKEQRIT